MNNTKITTGSLNHVASTIKYKIHPVIVLPDHCITAVTPIGISFKMNPLASCNKPSHILAPDYRYICIFIPAYSRYILNTCSPLWLFLLYNRIILCVPNSIVVFDDEVQNYSDLSIVFLTINYMFYFIQFNT